MTGRRGPGLEEGPGGGEYHCGEYTGGLDFESPVVLGRVFDTGSRDLRYVVRDRLRRTGRIVPSHWLQVSGITINGRRR